MNLGRQQRKPRILAFLDGCRRCGSLFAFVLAGAAGVLPGAPVFALTERVVTDPHTGLAIGGFDPVAYFTDAHAVAGQPRFEHRFAGVIWRFQNEGNLAAFANDPDVYAPRYGGYDPVALARGVVLPGNPLFWIINGERLYLFFDRAARDRFAADPKAAIDAAEAKWPALRRALLP
jgi:hypothetical protein